MPVICSVDGIEAEYQFFRQNGASNRCLISLRSQKGKLDLKKAFAGEGFAQYLFLYKQGLGRAKRRQAQTTLVGGTPVRWSSTELDSGGESIEIILGEDNRELFPCSGFVRGNLEGTIRAPALRLKMMGKDVWIFFLYFSDDFANGGDGYRIRSEKDALVVANGATSANAAITAVDGNPPKILTRLTSNGTDYKKIRLILDRAIGKGSLQDSIQEELTVLSAGEGGYKEASWAPVKRASAEVLWIFSSGSPSERDPLNDLLEGLGAKVNRPAPASFRDHAGGGDMDDFIIADDPTMSYQLGIMLEDGRADSEINDWTGIKLETR